jgi:hypothetical protein
MVQISRSMTQTCRRVQCIFGERKRRIKVGNRQAVLLPALLNQVAEHALY